LCVYAVCHVSIITIERKLGWASCVVRPNFRKDNEAQAELY